jgi:hypothetical protein
MGLETGGGQKTYLNISNGKVAVRCEESTDDAIKCSNKDGTKHWFEKRYPSVSGRLTGVTKRKTEWGTDLCLDIEDGGEIFQLQMGWNSSYAKGFLKCMPNIDVAKKITFSPWMKEITEGGKTKKKTALYLKQEGQENISWYWAKDAMNGCPEMVQIKVKGELTWDDTEQMEYLEAHLNDTFLPRLKTSPVATTTSAEAGKAEDRKQRDAEFMEDMNTTNQEEDGSNLPF